MKKSIMLTMAALAASAVFAEPNYGKISENWYVYNTVKFSTADKVEFGVYNSHFDMMKAYAESNNIPLFVFWGNYGCGVCKGVEGRIGGTGKGSFVEWLADKGVLAVFVISGETAVKDLGMVSAEVKRGKAFARTGGAFPFIGCYWPKEGVAAKKYPYERLGGSQSRASIEKMVLKVIAGYEPVPKNTIGSLGATDTEYDRYEVEAGAACSLPVTVVRESRAAKYKENTNGFVKVEGAKADPVKVAWEPGETKQEVFLELPALTAGTTLTLKVTDASGNELATNHVYCVETEPSASNPLWRGERTAGDAKSAMPLQFGEWTADLDCAKKTVESASGDAYTLVAIVGSLWCPDCYKTDKFFLDDPKFAAWATDEKQVALVSIDVPPLSVNDDGSKVMAPTLLSRELGTGYFDKDGKDGSFQKSGTAYLSRKGVDDTAAAEWLSSNILWASSNDYFHRPEDKNDNRTGVPILVLLRKDGTVAARLTRFAAKSPTDSTLVDQYLQRLDEMIAIAGGAGDHADKNEIANNCAGKGAVSLALGVEGEGEGEISQTDPIDTFRIAAANATVEVEVKGTDDAKVVVQLWTIDSDGKPVSLGEEARKEGNLKDGLTVSYDNEASGDCFVTVSNVQNYDKDETEIFGGKPKNTYFEPVGDYFDGSKSFFYVGKDGPTFAAFTVKATAGNYQPSEIRSTGAAAVGETKVTVNLKQGDSYRFTGLDTAACASVLDETATDGDYIYCKAKVGGEQTLTLAQAGGEFLFQLWHPGQVGFVEEKNPKTVKESDKQSNIVVRIDRPADKGLSGKVTLRVDLNEDESDFYVYNDKGEKVEPRFVWPEGGHTFTWKEGETYSTNVTITILRDGKIYQGDGKVVLDAWIPQKGEAGFETEAGEEHNGDTTVKYEKYTLTVKDAESAKKSTALFSAVTPFFSKSGTVYQKEGETNTLTVSRETNLIGGFELNVAAKYCTIDASWLGWDSYKGEDKYVKVWGVPVGKTAEVTLSVSSGQVSVPSNGKKVKVVGIAKDAPEFAEGNEAVKAFTFYRYVDVMTCDPTVKVNPEFIKKGDKVSFTKLSGTLPAGLKVSWNEVESRMEFSGVPTAAKDYGVVTYQIVVKRPENPENPKSKTTTINGMTCALSFKVIDPVKAGAGPEGDKPLNEAFAKSRTIDGIMLVDRCTAKDGEETAYLAGILKLTIPATGKVSAKFQCPSGTVSFASKSWALIDGTTGELGASLDATTKGCAGWNLKLQAFADGALTVTGEIGSGRFGEGASGEIVFNIPANWQWTKDRTAENYHGVYNVGFPVRTKSVNENLDGFAPRGTAYLQLDMSSSSAYKTGTMKWAGVLPDGTSVSGSSILNPGDGCAYLPVFKQSGKYVFAALPEILENAYDESKKFFETKGEDGCRRTVNTASLTLVGDDAARPVYAYWAHTENNKKTADFDYDMDFDTFGGIYDYKGIDKELNCCCVDFHGSTNMVLGASDAARCRSTYPEFGKIQPMDVTVGTKTITLAKDQENPNAFGKIAFTQKSGIVSGSFKLNYEDAQSGKTKTVSANYKGIVVVGWGKKCGCGEGGYPFVNGFWTFSDKQGYGEGAKTLTVKRGGLISIDTED